LRRLDGHVDGEVVLARHRRDFLFHALARHAEHRVDETVAREARLAHEAAERFAAAHAPGSVLGELHQRASGCNFGTISAAKRSGFGLDATRSTRTPWAASAAAVVAPAAATSRARFSASAPAAAISASACEGAKQVTTSSRRTRGASSAGG